MITLYKDFWKGAKDLGDKIDNPSWEEIESAIKELNQKERTQVALKCEDWSNISVGGGNEKYHVCLTTPNEQFFVLKDTKKENITSLESIVIGGQIGDYASYSIVSINLALKAVKTFFETGKKDEELFWNEE